MSQKVSEDLMDRASQFGVILDDISIVSSFMHSKCMSLSCKYLSFIFGWSWVQILASKTSKISCLNRIKRIGKLRDKICYTSMFYWTLLSQTL